MAITHFSVGVIGGVCVLLIFRRYRHPLTPLFLMFTGCWGMLPDIHWALPGHALREYHYSSVANVFFGHHYLDYVVDTTDSRTFAAVAVAGMCVAVATLCWCRYLAARHRTTTSSYSTLTDEEQVN